MTNAESVFQALGLATAERERRLAAAQARVIEAAKRLERLWSAGMTSRSNAVRDCEGELGTAVRALNELEGTNG